VLSDEGSIADALGPMVSHLSRTATLFVSFSHPLRFARPSKALKKRILPHGALEAAPNRDADFSIV